MLKIALAQMEVMPGHPDQNAAKMLAMAQEAKESQADVIVFPEMALPGYLLGDTWEQTAFLADCESYGESIIAAADGITIMFGNVAVDWERQNNDGRVRKYNAFFIAQGKKLIAPGTLPYPFIIKTLLPNYREFDDTRHFFSLQKLARELGRTTEELLAPVHLTIRGRDCRVGCMLCEDGWAADYPLSPGRIISREPLDFIVNISASPYTLGKNEKRHRVFGGQAQLARVPLVYVNNIGIQNNGKTIYTFDGASTVYDAGGRIAYEAEAYQEGLAVVDIEKEGEAHLPAKEPDIAAIYRALAFGIERFVARIGLKKIVIGVSGGIDSAVAAALYAAVVGPENVLLVNMPSRFNSATTKALAEDLAKRLGCAYTVIPIEPALELTVQQLGQASVADATGEGQTGIAVSDFVKENIQARDRGARVLAAIAAATGGGFTCNANKAEATVGYSTLYGDQAGFLSALADLWKYQVYELAHYLNGHVYKREVIPQGIIDIVPSAELSDKQNVDAGQGDPLKYPYHDYLFRAFVERWQKATPEDILTWYADGELEKKIGCQPGIVKKYFPTAAEFVADLERWWNLFTGMAVAKRIQAPPILAVSRRAYGFDHREAQNGPYYTRRYRELKQKILGA